jgi:hypothetical protein
VLLAGACWFFLRWFGSCWREFLRGMFPLAILGALVGQDFVPWRSTLPGHGIPLDSGI